MIGLQYPLMLFFLIPAAAAFLLIYRKQTAALSWIKDNISPRFLSSFTAYTKMSLIIHILLLFFLAVLLIAAAAGPYRKGTVEIKSESSP
jgi:hypothetical protein